MKIRLEAGIVLILGLVCLPIFLATPIITIKGHFVNDTGNPATSYDYVQTVHIYFTGNYEVYREGTILGVEVDGLMSEMDHSNWETAGYPYSYETKIVTLFGITLMILAGLALPFALGNPIIKWISFALGILGGLAAFIGVLLVLDFADFVYNDYYSNPAYNLIYNAAFIVPIVTGLLTIAASILSLILKPIKIIEIGKKEVSN